VNTRVLICNQQACARVDTRRLRALALWLLDRAAGLEPGFRLDELSIALVDDAGIAPINERFVKHPGATDVISFLFADVATGEVLLNVERACAVARRRGLDPSRELALYLAHGLQHLAGRDDATPRQRAAMGRVQAAWLRRAGPRRLKQLVFRPR
jgi:probable rRNA maturation factor